MPGTHSFATIEEPNETIKAWRRENNERRSYRAPREPTPDEPRLFDLRKVKGDPDTVDRNHTLVDQTVICNLSVCELAQRNERANELGGFGRRLTL
jgi:hypothetical protein